MNLTQEQKSAIETKDQYAVLIACAGSGKTTVLTERYKYLMRNGKSANNTALITFTRAAAEEMKKRLLESGEMPDSIAKSKICTFHSFGKSIIDSFFSNKRWKILDTTALSEKIIFDKPIVFAKSKEEAIEKIQNAKEYYLKPYVKEPKTKSEFDNNARFNEFLKIHVSSDINSEPSQNFKELFASYQVSLKNLHKAGFLDMADCVYVPVTMMEADNMLKARLQNMWKNVLVDEIQDSNTLEFKFLSLLDSGKNEFFFVGDDDQSIYNWRGSDSSKIKEWMDSHKIAAKALNTNFRSTQAVVNVANQFLVDNEFRLQKNMVCLNQGDKPELLVSSGFDYETKYLQSIIDSVKKFANEHEGHYNNEIAVVARTRSQVEKIKTALEQAGIPITTTTKVSDASAKCLDIIGYMLGINSLESLGVRQNVNLCKDPVKAIEEFERLGYFTGAKTLNSIKNKLKGKTLDDAYSELENDLMDKGGGVKRNADAVTISTIHGVKGLEFESVIVDMTANVFTQNNKIVTSEDCNIAHVACTRARKNLTIVAEGILDSIISNNPNMIAQLFNIPEPSNLTWKYNNWDLKEKNGVQVLVPKKKDAKEEEVETPQLDAKEVMGEFYSKLQSYMKDAVVEKTKTKSFVRMLLNSRGIRTKTQD